MKRLKGNMSSDQEIQLQNNCYWSNREILSIFEKRAQATEIKPENVLK